MAVHAYTRIALPLLLKAWVFLFPLILLPPWIDLLYTAGRGWGQAYLFQTGPELVRSFFTFFGPWFEPGITLGIRIEVVVVLLCVGFLAWVFSNRLWRVAAAILSVYGVFFLYFSFPSIIALVFGDVSVFSDVSDVLHSWFASSLLSTIHTPSPLPLDAVLLFEHQFNIFFARVWWIVFFIQAAVVCRLVRPRLFAVWKTNLRLERIVYYIGWTGTGIVIAALLFHRVSWNGIDIMAIAMVFFLMAINFWVAVGINDIADYDTDRIANPDRPFVSGQITKMEQQWITWGLFGFLVAGSLLINYLFFIFSLVFQVVYYLYSSPPFRIKKYFLLNNVFVAFNGVVAVLAGFFAVSPVQRLRIFPASVFWLLFGILVLAVHVKDIKDVAGDKSAGIITIPVLFGLERGKRIIGIFIALGVLLSSLFIGTLWGVGFCFLFAVLFYWALLRKPFEERLLFYFFYGYLACMLFFVFYAV